MLLCGIYKFTATIIMIVNPIVKIVFMYVSHGSLKWRVQVFWQYLQHFELAERFFGG